MKRFRGERIGDSPRIAVLSSDALGNYIATTPLLQMLRTAYPGALLHYYGGTRTQELWSCEPSIDLGFSLTGLSPRELVCSIVQYPPYDLIVNLEDSDWARSAAAVLAGSESFMIGPALGPDGRRSLPFQDDSRGALWRDGDWLAADVTERYPFLKSPFIGEIFCRLSYLEGEIPAYRIVCEEPDVPVPDVLVSTSASLAEKLWPSADWLEVVQEILDKGMSVGIVGASRGDSGKFWEGGNAEDALAELPGVADLRGRLTLPQVAGALRRARKVLTIDNGILHLAAAVRTPTVGLFRFGIHRLWMPPGAPVKALVPKEGEAVATIRVSEVKRAFGL